jgi:hypothetical protein
MKQSSDGREHPSMGEVRKIRPAERPRPLGPFDSDREVRNHPAIAPIIDSLTPHFEAEPQLALVRAGSLNKKLLVDALVGAGVELGDYDRAMIAWLAVWETETAAVIAGWIQRAGQGAR